MIYNEIIKALECCSKSSVVECEKCPYNSINVDCFSLEQDAIKLIRKQKEEIDRLRVEISKIKKVK